MICIAVIAYVDLIIRPSYWVKTMVKAPIFFLVPILYSFGDKTFNPFGILISNIKGLKTSFLLGIGIYTIILTFYFIANAFVDLSEIKVSLENNLGINKSNFWVIGLYVSIINSFLEEWFFRGFIFSEFKKSSRLGAYVISSLSFSVYHIAIMDGMFNVLIFALVLSGLMVGGMIFNYLNEKNANIYASWFCHSFANFSMNTIGFMLFFT